MAIPVKNPFISAVRGSLKIVSSASYTLTDLDGYTALFVTTGASDRTMTLPAASLSAGRRITFKKVDSGAGKVILSSAGSETLDGYTLSGNGYFLTAQHAFVTVECDGSNWFVVHTNGDYIQGFATVAHGASDDPKTQVTLPLGPGLWALSGTCHMDNYTGMTSIQFGWAASVNNTDWIGVNDMGETVSWIYHPGVTSPVTGSIQYIAAIASPTTYYWNCRNLGTAGGSRGSSRAIRLR